MAAFTHALMHYSKRRNKWLRFQWRTIRIVVDGTAFFYVLLFFIFPLVGGWFQWLEAPPTFFRDNTPTILLMFFFLSVRGIGWLTLFEAADALFLANDLRWRRKMITHGARWMWGMTGLYSVLCCTVILPVLSTTSYYFGVFLLLHYSLSLTEGYVKRWCVLRGKTIMHRLIQSMIALIGYGTLNSVGPTVVGFVLLLLILAHRKIRNQVTFWSKEVELAARQKMRMGQWLFQGTELAASSSVNSRPRLFPNSMRIYRRRADVYVFTETFVKWLIRSHAMRGIVTQFILLTVATLVFAPVVLLPLLVVLWNMVWKRLIAQWLKQFFTQGLSQLLPHVANTSDVLQQHVFRQWIAYPALLIILARVLVYFFV
ncbi:MAG: ABC transporter permease [Bacilli bacterium]